MCICSMKSTVGCLKTVRVAPKYLHKSKSSLLTVQKLRNLRCLLYSIFRENFVVVMLSLKGLFESILFEWVAKFLLVVFSLHHISGRYPIM